MEIEKETNVYLTKKQAIEKYKFLTENMLRNILHKNINGFREKVTKKLGRRVLIDDNALKDFLRNLGSKN